MSVHEEYHNHARIWGELFAKQLDVIITDFRNGRITGDDAHTEIISLLEAS